jgi:ectoine hydroxylase-related dioxygenase (phytanoyl-CoA dioxygenase family)
MSIRGLDDRYEITEGQVDLFDQQGFVKLTGVLSEEMVAYFEPEITAKVIELNTMHLPMEQRSTFDKAFLQVIDVWRSSQRAKEFVFAKRFAGIAADLLGVTGVRLYHDQALYKEAGGGITPWHADEYYWPFSTDRCVTIWAPLQDTPIEMGPLTFAAGSHRFDYGRDMAISDESEATMAVALEAENLRVVEEPYEIGDVSYHLGWTFHHASPNTTDRPRRVITVIYMDADMPIGEPRNEGQRAVLERAGLTAGEVPDSAIKPMLFGRRSR